MNTVLTELGKQVAARSATHLALPGLAFGAAVLLALHLGHAHALDVTHLAEKLSRADPTPASPSARLISAVVTAVAAIAGGTLAASAVGVLAAWLWASGERLPGAYRLTARRRARWDGAYAEVSARISDLARARRLNAGGSTEEAQRLREAMVRCERICPVRPRRPFWISDRLRAVDERLHRTYRLDLGATWPRLWLLLPEESRSALGRAQHAYTSSARLIGWAVLYTALGSWWWPSFLVGAVVAVVAWFRTRTVVQNLADLVESAVDLYACDLADQVGVDCEGPFSREAGDAVTAVLRKDETLHPLP
ncbi:hypothetical protein ACFXKD_03400 [Nocardiopsis aegyptia]|uniref:hypothetical protein n=1 Tax=Nocardiopsis aegyptia TaxID=220378 RepID=UPI00366B5ED3